MNNAPASTLTGQVVSLLDILRAHAEVYVRATKTLTLITTLINEEKNKGADVRLNVGLLQRLKAVLDDLLRHCEYLPMTALAASDLVEVIDSPTIMPAWTQTELSLMTSISEIQNRLHDELSINLFFKLPQERKKYFDNPVDGWEEIIHCFQNTASDVEEMSKCFALSRYAAAVYHACQAIESGLIQFGIFLEVTDPKSGWTAVTNRLMVLLEKTKRSACLKNIKIVMDS